MTFDRLIYIDRLRSCGVDEQVARAHADALQDALNETVATKGDVLDVARELRAELDVRFAAVDSRLAQLDNKIEIFARDLTIRGAGGLVVIAGIIIGLKLFA